MPTTPVNIDVQTQPNGDVTVSIRIAGAIAAAGLPQGVTTQLHGGEYGVEGLAGNGSNPQGGVLVEPNGTGGWRETWILENNPANLDAFLSGGFQTRYLDVAISVDDTIRKAGLNGPTTNIVMDVNYNHILPGGSVPTPSVSAGQQTYVFVAFNIDPGGNRTTPFPLAFLFRAFDPNPGGPKTDTWAFAQNFQLADATTQILVEPWNFGPPPDAAAWAALATAHCPGGSYTVITL